jgi:CubicO group peptidase (beta-lactamase class C family)
MDRRHFSSLWTCIASAGLWLFACADKAPSEADAVLPETSAPAATSRETDRGTSGAGANAPAAGRNDVRASAGATAQPKADMAGSSAGAAPAKEMAGSGGSPTAAGSGGSPTAAGSGSAPMAGASGAASPPDEDAGMPDAGAKPMWPVAADGWPTATPADFGIEMSQLETLGTALQTASGGTRSGLVVVKEGALIYEKYWEGDAATTHQVFSCTKSWGSTLIGIAVRQGLITVEDPVTKWVPEPAREVGSGALIKHLLTQTGQTTPPGTAFAYNSGSIINTLPEILEAVTSMPSHAFFETFLAKPLKLSMDWPVCPAGGCVGTRYKADYIQFGDQGPNGVLKSTIRDQAKLGWLWLDDGVWNGERLLDTSYIQAATQPSFDFQSVYGYLWWLNREGRSSVLSYNPEVPDDMYHAVGGIGNCSVAVLPKQRMVIAHVGALDAGGLGGHWEVFAPLFKP